MLKTTPLSFLSNNGFLWYISLSLCRLLFVCIERLTKGLLKEYLAKYGKEVDMEREEKKRMGMTQKESAAAIVKDYALPLTPDQYIKEITPMYREK